MRAHGAVPQLTQASAKLTNCARPHSLRWLAATLLALPTSPPPENALFRCHIGNFFRRNPALRKTFTHTDAAVFSLVMG
jgi:hypothetical protein